nr:RNA pseudouridine synthase 4, mitochondrial isoform X1 [Ipomoea trifida]
MDTGSGHYGKKSIRLKFKTLHSLLCPESSKLLTMAELSVLRRASVYCRRFTAVLGDENSLSSGFFLRRCHCATTTAQAGAEREGESAKRRDKWFTLPPYTPSIDGAALGKELAGRRSDTMGKTVTTMTALKWILHCCPELPRSLVQKLFRLRQVRRVSAPDQEQQRKRVNAKELMNTGDKILLPVTVEKFPTEKEVEHLYSEEQREFLHSIELYKDPTILVVNKPPGMPVQGGVGIKRSLDELAAKYMRYGYPEPPRLVHRLDRDCSGILVMGRTQLSATVLHSIFREKTFEASNDDLESTKRTLQKKYWALVIGCPRRAGGIISVPLGKVMVDNGKSDRITVMDDDKAQSAQFAVTEYRVIEASDKGYTWLELSPLTGRKHQLRVHCAEVLGTPILGDYKYGWQAHRKLKHLHLPRSASDTLSERLPKEDPFGLGLGNGSVSDKQPHLHLHCKEIVLPNISLALQRAQRVSDSNLADVETIKLVAPLPPHMQRTWDHLIS